LRESHSTIIAKPLASCAHTPLGLGSFLHGSDMPQIRFKYDGRAADSFNPSPAILMQPKPFVGMTNLTPDETISVRAKLTLVLLLRYV